VVELRPGKVGEIEILGTKIPVIFSNNVKKDSSTIYFAKPKNPEKVKEGRTSRAAGKDFEKRVQADLESKGWIVFRNSNDVEFMEGVITKISGDPNVIKGTDTITNTPYKDGIFKQAKTKWNFYTKMPMSLQSGFPDFVCIKICQNYVVIESENDNPYPSHATKFLNDYSRKAFEVQFVECKTNGLLDKKEKEKIEWIKNNLKIPVIIAIKQKEKGRIKIEYERR
jgi:hypothetical protein